MSSTEPAVRAALGMMAAMAEGNEGICHALWADLSPDEQEGVSRATCHAARVFTGYYACVANAAIIVEIPEDSPEVARTAQHAAAEILLTDADPPTWLRDKGYEARWLAHINARFMDMAIGAAQELFPHADVPGILRHQMMMADG